MLTRQESQTQLNYNQSLDCVIPMQQLQYSEQTVVAGKATVRFFEGNEKLEIQGGVVVNKLELPKQERPKNSHKKNTTRNSKIHSSFKDHQVANQNTSSQGKQDLSEKVFSVNKNAEQLKSNCREIKIESSYINVYALKKLVRIVQGHLVKLRIENCIFYESDKAAMLKQSFSSNSASNNKMLRELIFAFQIKSILLPEIEGIEIILLKQAANNSDLSDSGRREISHTFTKEQDFKQKLADEYNCNKASSFIDFEMSTKSILEKKFSRYKSQSEAANYIIKGDQQHKADVTDCINDNIVNDIQEHIHAFTKYIKGSLLSNNIFVVRGYCLEDPIACKMVENMMIKNRKHIEIVIFKETGTIPNESFLKVINILIGMNKLLSIAFFDAQPQFEPTPYLLLRELNYLKAFKFIILNRSSFDLTYYQQHILENGRNQKELCNNKREPFKVNPPPKHYAFYILDTKDKSRELQEFTPYKYCISDLLFPNQSFESEEQTDEAILKHQIGHLIKKQKEEYPLKINLLIESLQNEELLTFTGINEGLISKYSKENSKEQCGEYNQIELENDIRTLIKHANVYSITCAKRILAFLKQPTTKNNLQLECNLFEEYTFMSSLNDYDLNRIFIHENSLFPNIIQGNLIGEAYISNGFPKKVLCSENTSYFYSYGKQMIDQIITNFDIDEFLSRINEKAEAICLIFGSTNFLIEEEINSKDFQKAKKCPLFIYQFADSPENIFLSDQFLQVLMLIITNICKLFPFKLEYNNQRGASNLRLCLSHLEKFSKCSDIKIEQLNIQGESEGFYFSPIFYLLPIKVLFIDHFKIDGQSFQGVTHPFNFEKIKFQRCEIESLDYSCLSNQIYLLKCKIEESEIQKLLLDQKDNFKIMQKSSNKSESFIYLKESLDTISQELASLIVTKESILKFFWYNPHGQVLNKLKKEISKYFPSTLNPLLLQKFSGKQNSHFLFATDADENSRQRQHQRNSSSQTNINSMEDVNKSKQRIDEKQENSISNLFSQLTEIYSNDRSTGLQADLLLQGQRQYGKCDTYIGKCCLDSLDNLEQTFQKNNFNLKEEVESHHDKLCFFNTSVFQVPFRPKSIQLRFFNNLLFDEPDQLFKHNKMEWIEELDFREQIIAGYEQIQFLDLLIQLSPRLERLSIKWILFAESAYDDRNHITPLKSHKELKHLELEEMESNDSSDFCLSILDAVLVSESAANLQTLNVLQTCKDKGYNERVYQIIEKSKNTLQVLKVKLENEDQWNTLQQCTNLQKLSLQCNIISFPISQMQELQQLKSLTIFVDLPCLDQIFFNSLLDGTLKNQQLNCQQIAIRCYKQEAEHQNMKCFNDLYDRKEKWPTYDTYYLEKESSNNEIPGQKQILLISQRIQVKQCIQDQDKGVRINIKEYLLANYQKAIKQATFSILQEIPRKPLLSAIQELRINKQENYVFLNKVFEYAKQKCCLTVISFDDCHLENNSLQGIDFSKLPMTLRLFCIGGKNSISSLEFFKPLLTHKQQLYKNMVLDVYQTQIPLKQIIKYAPHLKRIYHKFYKLWEVLRPIFQQMYLDIDQQVAAVQGILPFVRDYKLDLPIALLHLKLILHSKLSNPNELSKQIYPFFYSPLQIMQSPLQLTALKNILDIFDKQKEDSIFSIKRNFGNPYLFYLCQLINNSHQYILSHRRCHNDSYLHLGKLNDSHYQGGDEPKFSQREHMFFDYLLLVELAEKFNVKQVILPIELEISQEFLENKLLSRDLDELTMIENVCKIPPSELTLDHMSIHFIKTWYVISFISPLSFKTRIQRIKPDAIYNTSIGHFLTQNLHRNNLLRSILSGTPLKYRFDDTVQLLATYFEDQIADNKHAFLLGLFPLYLFVCFFGVVYFSLHFNVTCGHGISWYSYYSYLIYGFLTLWLELVMFKRCLNYISHLIPFLEIDLNPNFIISLINFIKQSIIDTPWINQWYMGYSYSFLQSQIARFDNFTNVSFLYSAYQCGDYVIFYLALSFMAIPFLYTIFQFFKLIFKPNKNFLLPTASLDIYYNICSIIEFRAVSDILDLVSPSNVLTLKGRMFNARIVSFFIRIVCESMPLVAIQVYNLTKRTMTSSLVLSLLLSAITFISLTVSVLTITPSTLNQEDFNQLNEKKRKERVTEKYEERLQIFEKEAFALRFYEHLKTLRRQYLTEKKKGDISLETANKYKANMEYFEKLFDSPKEQQLHSVDGEVKDTN